jgi:hypothetical protein
MPSSILRKVFKESGQGFEIRDCAKPWTRLPANLRVFKSLTRYCLFWALPSFWYIFAGGLRPMALFPWPSLFAVRARVATTPYIEGVF